MLARGGVVAKHDTFSAAASAAGYYYQARLALAEALRFAYAESGVEVAIEKLDDVSFESAGSPLELLQSKHHIDKATKLLVAVAKESSNAVLKSSFDEFLSLTSEMQRSLLDAVDVLDASPNIVDLESIIEERLKMIAPRGKTKLAREHLEGWWWPRICKALLEPGVGKVSILELEARLDDIREIMKRDALPVEMDNVEVDDQHLEALDELTFVRQLRLNQAWSSTHRTCKARFLPCIHATIPLDP